MTVFISTNDVLNSHEPEMHTHAHAHEHIPFNYYCTSYELILNHDVALIAFVSIRWILPIYFVSWAIQNWLPTRKNVISKPLKLIIIWFCFLYSTLPIGLWRKENEFSIRFWFIIVWITFLSLSVDLLLWFVYFRQNKYLNNSGWIWCNRIASSLKRDRNMRTKWWQAGKMQQKSHATCIVYEKCNTFANRCSVSVGNRQMVN